MFREGRHVGKDTRRNTSISYIEFSSKIYPKLTKKIRNAAVTAKIDKKNAPWDDFFRKNRFSVVLEIPEGTPKLLKIYEFF